MADPSTVASLPLCGDTPLLLSNGFSMCSGTPGDGDAVGPIINAETAHSKAFIASYNTGTDDACITTGVPQAGAVNAWNTVGYTTAQGCCSTDATWAAAGLKPAATNAARATRLQPFTTASALGANDSANIDGGLPTELTALQKVWGMSPKNWAHGGVHQDNVGVWQAAPGSSFTVKWGAQTWQQASLLWSRQTGDNYQPNLDPYGTANPAPDGLFFQKAAKPGTDLTNCKGCNVSNGQVMGSGSGTDACGDPFGQVCGDTSSINTNTSDAPWTQYTDDKGKSQPGFANTQTPFDTPTPNGYSNPKGRVGGVFATQSMYGPGKFSVLANLPPTAVSNPKSPLIQSGFPGVNPKTGAYPYTGTDALPGGRGYVFALWTFSYTEAYSPGKNQTDWPYSMGLASQCVNDDGDAVLNKPDTCGSQVYTQSAEVLGSDGKLTNASRTYPDIPGLVQGSTDDGTYAVHNHEIDIEIPANSGEFQGPNMMDKLGLDTANFNTWQTDDNSYTAGALALYQQAQCTAPKGKFFCAVAPENDQNTYHEYTFVWYVDPASADPSKPDGSYVAFYMDGVELYRVKRFVPRRSGRVLIGLWPAWWGSNYNPMDFNQVYCKIARMEFVPQGGYDNVLVPMLVTNGSQMFDQVLPSTGADISCGIGVITDRKPTVIAGDGGPVPPSVAPATAPASGMPLWQIIVIVIACVIVVAGAIVGGIWYYEKTQGKELKDFTFPNIPKLSL